LPWCIDRVGDVELPECTVPLAASVTALNTTTTLDVVLPVSNAKPPPNQVLAATNQIAQLQNKATYSNNESSLEQNDPCTSGRDEIAVNVAAFSQVPPSAHNVASNEKDELKRVNALKKHPYNYHMKQQPSSGLIWNRSSRKNILLHNQVLCLVQHALKPVDVPMFIASVETIKSSNGQFPNVVPMLVRKEIFEKFCISTVASSNVDVVNMYDSDHIEVS